MDENIDEEVLEQGEKRENPMKRPISDVSNQDVEVSKPKKVKKKKNKPDPRTLELRRKIQTSCSINDFQTAIEAYENMHVKEGIPIEAMTFYNLLNLCDGREGKDIHIGTPKPGTTKKKKNAEKEELKVRNNDEKSNHIDDLNENHKPSPSKSDGVCAPSKKYSVVERKDFAFRVKKEMDRLQIPLPETAITPLVRLLCKTGDLEEAEALISQAESRQQCKPKLRMYSALIDEYCKRNNLTRAIRIFSRMQFITRKNKTGSEEIKIEPTEREYCAIMKCAVQVGDVKVMERFLSDLAEEILVPCSETTNAIIQWFESSHAVCQYSGIELESALDQHFPPSHAPNLGPLQYKVKSNENATSSRKWDVSKDVQIDPKSGCLLSGCLEGCKLQPISLQSSQAWQDMMVMNEDIVLKGELEAHKKITQFAGGGKGKKRIANEDMMKKRKRKWAEFIEFLTKRYGPPFSSKMGCDGSEPLSPEGQGKVKKSPLHIVIDGANIGYYKQNFAGSPKHVDYRQIDKAVKYFMAKGQSTLLFLHQRHFAKNLIPRWAESIVEEWERDGILYRTPHGSNDDWFWMHAALWCGEGTFVLTNDEMRDHHFQMLSHRPFTRWKERHQVIVF